MTPRWRRYLRRIRLAFVLAWTALRGRTVEIEVGGPDGTHHFTGIRRGLEP